MIIYSKYNSYRKEEFQLVTNIEKEEDLLFSSKIARNKNAKVFLASFFEKCDYLKKNMFSFDVIEPKKINDMKINFEYKKGKTLDSLLFEIIQKLNKEKFINLIKKYVGLIKKSEIKNDNLSPDFKEIFGGEDETKFDCAQVGCLDLNFDNIILDDNDSNKFWVIDYEWTFNFPVPYKYLIFRALTAFYGNYFYYNLNKNFIKLSELYEIFEITPQEKNTFVNFEYNFQKYVGNSFNISLEDYYKNYGNLEIGFIGLDNICNFQQEDRKLLNLKQSIQVKDQEIQFMKSSKFWKLRNKYLELKNKFKIG